MVLTNYFLFEFCFTVNSLYQKNFNDVRSNSAAFEFVSILNLRVNVVSNIFDLRIYLFLLLSFLLLKVVCKYERRFHRCSMYFQLGTKKEEKNEKKKNCVHVYIFSKVNVELEKLFLINC